MSTVWLQVQQPASKWEFYICNEIKSRLTDLNDPVDVVWYYCNTLKIWTPKKIAVITLKFQQGGFTIE